jgi:hypothetical protein
MRRLTADEVRALYLSQDEVRSLGFPETLAAPPLPPYDHDIWLAPIRHPGLRAQALAGLDAGDVTRFLMSASNTDGLALVCMNHAALRARGIYEAALLHAFHATRTNNRHYRTVLPLMFSWADRARLRAAGDLLPGPGPFTIYRGVAGQTSARQIRGFSWSASIEKARWFANRWPDLGLHDPAVYRVTVGEADVLAYLNGREEEEFLVMLPASAKLKRVE